MPCPLLHPLPHVPRMSFSALSCPPYHNRQTYHTVIQNYFSIYIVSQVVGKANTSGKKKMVSWVQHLMVYSKIPRTFPKMKKFDNGFNGELRNGTALINCQELWWQGQDLHKTSQSEFQHGTGRPPSLHPSWGATANWWPLGEENSFS